MSLGRPGSSVVVERLGGVPVVSTEDPVRDVSGGRVLEAVPSVDASD